MLLETVNLTRRILALKQAGISFPPVYVYLDQWHIATETADPFGSRQPITPAALSILITHYETELEIPRKKPSSQKVLGENRRHG